MAMNVNRFDIQASSDLAGHNMLQVMCTKYQGILGIMEPDKKETAK